MKASTRPVKTLSVDVQVASNSCLVSPPRGFLRSDKPIGTAVVKLDKLEVQSEVREIVEVRKTRRSLRTTILVRPAAQLRSVFQVMNGRKPTGGRVEVKVRLREPLSGQDVQTSTERWLVIDHAQVRLKPGFTEPHTDEQLLMMFGLFFCFKVLV